MNREDLFRYREDKQYYESQLEDIQKILAKLYGTTPAYSENFGGKGTTDKIGDGVANLIDKQKDSQKEIEKQLADLELVKQAVNEMKTRKFRNILYWVYISEHPKNLGEIANYWERNENRTYSYNHVTVLHRQALEEFDRLFKNR